MLGILDHIKSTTTLVWPVCSLLSRSHARVIMREWYQTPRPGALSLVDAGTADPPPHPVYVCWKLVSLWVQIDDDAPTFWTSSGRNDGRAYYSTC